MEAFLKDDPKIQVLFAHNDQMALGAIQAIKEAGLQPGKDITIVSMDAVKGIFQAIVAGEANCTIECNPLLGPQAVQAIHDLRAGKKLPARIWTIESQFDATNAEAALPTRQYYNFHALIQKHAGPPPSGGGPAFNMGPRGSGGS